MRSRSEDEVPSFIVELINQLDDGEDVKNDTFYKAVWEALQNTLSTEKSLTEQLTSFANLFSFLTFKDNDTNRFQMDSPFFKSIEEILTKLIDDAAISPLLKGKLAVANAMLYSGAIPQSGLSVSHPCLQGCLKWHNYIIDRPALFGKTDPALYLESCEYVSGVYERRAQKTFPDLPLNMENPYIKLAKNYLEKGLPFINSQALSYQVGAGFLKQFAELHESYLDANATLADQSAQDTIHAFERLLDYVTAPPAKKITTYITPSTAELELSYGVAKWKALSTNDPDDIAKAKKLEKEYTTKLKTTGMQMWDRAEKYAARQDTDFACSKLGWLYVRLPKAKGQDPDYQKATDYFLLCQDKHTAAKALRLPELNPYLPKRNTFS